MAYIGLTAVNLSASKPGIATGIFLNTGVPFADRAVRLTSVPTHTRHTIHEFHNWASHSASAWHNVTRPIV